MLGSQKGKNSRRVGRRIQRQLDSDARLRREVSANAVSSIEAGPSLRASISCAKPDIALVEVAAESAGWVVLDAGAAFAGDGS